MQKWEFKCVLIYLSPTLRGSWKEDGRQLPGDPDMVAKARELGHQGWELVSVAPYGNPEGLWHWFKRPLPEGVPPPLPKV